MKKTEIQHPDKLVATGAYSAGVLIDRWLYISGQGPLDLASGKTIRGTIEQETVTTLDHIQKILHAANLDMDSIVKCTVHLLDINEFDRFNSSYHSYFKDKGVTVLPARTTVQSVLYDQIKVEIDAVARTSM